MRLRSIHLVLGSLLSLSFVVMAFASPAPASGNARKLVGDYRKAGSDTDARAQILDQVLALGAEDSAALQAVIERELQSLLQPYEKQLTRLASRVVKKRRVRGSELAKLRETVLALSHRAGLTKQAIVERGDPAVDRLRELLIVEPFELWKDEEFGAELEERRRRILELGDHWLRCDETAATGRTIAELQSPEPASFEEVLERYERHAVTMAMKIGKSDRKVLIENQKIAWSIDSGEALGILDLNILRLMLGLNALRIDVPLCAAARDHSNDMRTLGFFAHESPVAGKRSFSDRASRFRASAHSENIAYGSRSPVSTNSQWFHSPGHHKNMLGSHSKIGLGRSASHWTQLFG